MTFPISQPIAPALIDRVQELRSSGESIDPTTLASELTALAETDDGTVNPTEADLIDKTVRAVAGRQLFTPEKTASFDFPDTAPAAEATPTLQPTVKALNALTRSAIEAGTAALIDGDRQGIRKVHDKAQRHLMDGFNQLLGPGHRVDPAIGKLARALMARLDAIDESGRQSPAKLTRLQATDADIKALLAAAPPELKGQLESLHKAFSGLEHSLSFGKRTVQDFPSLEAAANAAQSKAAALPLSNGRAAPAAYVVVDQGASAAPDQRFRIFQAGAHEVGTLNQQAQSGGRVARVYHREAGGMQVAAPRLPHASLVSHGHQNLFDPKTPLDPNLRNERAAQRQVLVGVGKAAKDVLDARFSEATNRLSSLIQASPDEQVNAFQRMLTGHSDATVAKAMSVLTGSTVSAGKVATMRAAFDELRQTLEATPKLSASERQAAIKASHAAAGLPQLITQMQERLPGLQAAKDKALDGMLINLGGRLLREYDDPSFRQAVFDKVGFTTLPTKAFPPPGLDTDEAILARAQRPGGFASNAEMLFVQAEEDADDAMPVVQFVVGALETTLSMVPKFMGPVGWGAETAMSVGKAVTDVDRSAEAADAASLKAMTFGKGVDGAAKAISDHEQQRDNLGRRIGSELVASTVDKFGGDLAGKLGGSLATSGKIATGVLAEGVRAAGDTPQDASDALARLAKTGGSKYLGSAVGQMVKEAGIDGVRATALTTVAGKAASGALAIANEQREAVRQGLTNAVPPATVPPSTVNDLLKGP